MICEDCGKEMVRFGNYDPPIWKCYDCNIEVEGDGDDFEDKQTTFDNEDGERI